MLPQHSQDTIMSCGGEFDDLSDNSPLLLNTNSNGSNCSSGGLLTMSQQQQQLFQQNIVFGSQKVNKNSSTPYTDATQVSYFFFTMLYKN